MTELNPRITGAKIKEYYERYVVEYRRILEEKYPDKKNDFWLYRTFPLKIKVYFDGRSIVFHYITETPEFVVEVQQVKETRIPEIRTTKFYGGAASLSYFVEYIDRPEEKAAVDIDNDIAEKDWLKKREEEETEYWQEHYNPEQKRLDGVNARIERHLEIISEATQQVQKRTKEKHYEELDYVYNLQMNFLELINHCLDCDFSVINAVYWTVYDDIEASIFLVYSGKYIQAMGSLRRVFENMTKAIYYESLKTNKQLDKKGITENDNKIQRWINGDSQEYRFANNGGILDTIVGGANELLIEITKSTSDNFNYMNYAVYLKEINTNLSQYVHFRGKGVMTLFESPIFLSDYNEERFTEWYKLFSEVFNIINLMMLVKLPLILENFEKLKSEDKKDLELPSIPKKQFEILMKFCHKRSTSKD